MARLQAVLTKYLTRLEQLASEGEAVPIRTVQVASGGNYLTKETYYKQQREVSWPEFVAWRTKCVTVLDQVVPHWSVHRKTVEGFPKLEATPSGVQFGISFLRSVHDDLRDGFFERLTSDIEAHVVADYVKQAEELLGGNAADRASDVASAVLAGAVLERSLRRLCEQLAPPEPVTAAGGKTLTLGALIDTLKRRAVFNELTAKQLRAWADIRNSAAHGRFDEFGRDDVRMMISGVQHFVAQQS